MRIPRVGSLRFIVAAIAVAGLVATMATGVLAAGIPGDPTTVIAGAYTGWVTTAQGFARQIYLALFIFEIIAVAITTLLFRENLGEFFASVGFKVLMGGVFFWFISYGPTLAQQAINWFANIGETNFGGSDPGYVVSGFLAAGTGYFAAANLAHLDVTSQLTALTTPPICVWAFTAGACPVALISEVSSEHAAFILIVQGLGLMIVLGAVGILLQFSIVTIESYLVMSVGILMVGFAGSRWTFSFSQGYFSYMINVGVKLMVTYIILGVAAKELVPILLTAAVTVGLAAGFPFGVGDEVATGAAAVSAVYVLLTLGLLWTIPAFTAAILSGQSQSSGSAILQQAMGSFAGAAQAFAQFGAARQAGAGAAESRETMRDLQQAHAAGAGGASNASALAAQPMSSGGSMERQFASGSAPSTGALSGIGVAMPAGTGPTLLDNAFTNGSRPAFAPGAPGPGAFGPINPTTGMSYAGSGGGSYLGGGSGPSFNDMRPEDINHLSRGEYDERLANTDFSTLSPSQEQAIADSRFAPDADRMLASKAERSDEQAELNRAYGMGGLAQAAPRDIGQPSAVQVRISNPDKL